MSSTTNNADRPAVDAIKAFLHRTLRISITDGRVFLGTFSCTDKQLNIVLTNTEEFRPGAPPSPFPVQGRYVAMVMVPWKLVEKIELQDRFSDDLYM